MRTLFSTTFLLIALTAVACAQDVPIVRPPQQPAQTPPKKPATPARPKLPPDQNKFAVVIVGLGGEEGYSKQFAEWAASLREKLLGDLGFAPEKVLLFAETPEAGAQKATAENVRQAFVGLRNALSADNQLFVFFIGHGSFDGKVAKFNLIGPDLTPGDYAQLLNNLPARRVAVINTASASGEFIKPLTGDGRIVITATRSGMEQNATHFPEYFISALGNPEADTDKNSRVSVLEAFEYASKLTEAFYKQKASLATEHSLLEDNGDGVGHSKAEEGDGSLSKLTFFDSLPQQQAGGNPELAKLFSERLRLEGEIEQLKTRKAQMKEDEFDDALEKLLIELARLNQNIKTKQK
ncbi:MAG: hypothetical protein SF339_19190 [Blastocatellia bacterium]|nr:hypothetical protein [Blastocatellia bacterium]